MSCMPAREPGQRWHFSVGEGPLRWIAPGLPEPGDTASAADDHGFVQLWRLDEQRRRIAQGAWDLQTARAYIQQAALIVRVEP